MKFFQNINENYQKMCNLIIRPPRYEYSMSNLGPCQRRINGTNVFRQDFTLKSSREYKIFASIFHNESKISRSVVVYLHGNSSSRLEAINLLKYIIPAGLDLFCYDAQGCGMSEGQYISLGWWQSKDLRLVLIQLQKRGYEKICLWGRSMGAVTILMLQQKVNKLVKALVLDSPFASLKMLAEELCKKHTKIPGFILAVAMKIISGSIKDKADFDIYDLDPVSTVNKFKTPAFFISADKDSFVSSKNSIMLHQHYGGPKHIQLVSGDHNSARPFETMQRLVQFVIDSLDLKRDEISLGQTDPEEQKQVRLGNEEELKSVLLEFGLSQQRESESVPKMKLLVQNPISLPNASTPPQISKALSKPKERFISNKDDFKFQKFESGLKKKAARLSDNADSKGFDVDDNYLENYYSFLIFYPIQ